MIRDTKYNKIRSGLQVQVIPFPEAYDNVFNFFKPGNAITELKLKGLQRKESKPVYHLTNKEANIDFEN